MNGRILVGAAAAALGLVCGCQGSHADLTPGEMAALLGPRAADPGGGTTVVARSQQPEGDAKAPINLLDLPPQTAADLTGGQPAARIAATVGAEAILTEELIAAAYPALMAARELPEPERTQKRGEALNQALNQLVEREVVLQDAFARLLKNGGQKNLDKLTEAAREAFDKQWLKPMMRGNHLEDEAQLKAALASQGLSLEMVRRQWERNFMATEYLRNRVRPYVEAVGPHEVLEYYDGHPEEFRRPDSVEWQDLFIPDHGDDYPTREDAHRFAEALAERVRRGEDFAALSEQYDKGLSAYRKGEGVGRTRGEIRPPEVETILFQLKEGEAAVVELDSGFHVVRVVKREYAGPTPFDEKTQRQIKEKLSNDVAQREMKRIVNKLKHDAVIEYAHK